MANSLGYLMVAFILRGCAGIMGGVILDKSLSISGLIGSFLMVALYLLFNKSEDLRTKK